MSDVELSIQLQIRDITAVQQAYSTAVVDRDPATLWWLVDSASDIAYENRVKGSSILAIDDSIANVKIGSSVFGDWFNLQNSYFSQDQPIAGVQSLKQAIELAYRWRVPQYFNDVALTGSGQGISPQYVFPYADFNVGTFEVGGTSPTPYVKGAGPQDPAVVGPGILAVTPFGPDATGSDMTLALTAVYPDGTTGTMDATVPGGSEPTEPTVVGEIAVTTGVKTSGLVTVAAGGTTHFKVGPLNLVVIVEDKTGTTPNLWLSEVAEIHSINAGANQLTLRQPTPPGATTPFPDGLRHDYTSAAKIYPLFTDVNAITSSAGDTGDKVRIGFHPDWPQGFVDVSSISSPQ